MDVKLQVRQYIEKYHMIRPGDLVLAGLSGGADSTALLCLLAELRAPLGFTLTAVHVNHGIRGAEAERDEEFSRSLCLQLAVPFTARHVDVPALAQQEQLSLEEAGRRVRYAIFREEGSRLLPAGELPTPSCPSVEMMRTAEDTTSPRLRIAVAHHQDDQAETVLLNLCRGTGIRGIGAMAPVSGEVIRPLLGITREELREWLRSIGQDWCEDSTNQETEMTRNRIRQHILPELTGEINPQTAAHLAAAAEQAREIDAWIEAEAERWIEEHAERREYSEWEEQSRADGSAAGTSDERHDGTDRHRKSGSRLEISELRLLPSPLRRRILLHLTASAVGGAKDITARHLEALDCLVMENHGGSLNLHGGVTARRIGGELWILPQGEKMQDHFPERNTRGSGETPQVPDMGTGCDAECPPADAVDDAIGRNSDDYTFTMETFHYTGQKIPEKRYTKWFDYDKIKGTVRIRAREKGDTLALAGVGHKSLRRYMIDAHIPAEERDRVPLLADEESVLWVIGGRMSAEHQVTAATRRVLAVTVQRK